MSDPAEKPDNVVPLVDAFKSAQRRERRPRPKAADKDKPKDGGSGRPPFDPPPERPGLPERLPDNSPVKALGTQEGIYFYLDKLGQLRRNKQSEHGRLHILDLFGGWEYLRETWPVWTLIDGKWERKAEFNHSFLGPVLMSSCGDRGVWDPSDRVRGCGTWIEDSGELVMHCGGHLWRAFPDAKTPVIRDDAGLKGDLLYPRRSPLAEPEFGTDLKQTGPRILDQLETWSFKRGELDQRIVLGWIVAALMGQAPIWRPMMWVTGGAGCGKSTLLLLIEWIIGDRAAIKPAATSQAYVYQKIGDSALPVLLDEFEAKDDNTRQQTVIELMRIAASGGELGRGGSENNPKTYTLKSCFAAFSILIPPLSPQDRSRMAIVELRKLAKREEGEEFDFAADGDHNLALGDKARWTKTGKELRGRILQQWPRYRKTFHAYFRALQKMGHDARAASQFGALGAAQDIALFDDLTEPHIKEWTDLLQIHGMAEKGGYLSEPEACLQHLLSATPDLVRHGTRETVAQYLRLARADIEQDKRTNDPDEAARILAKIGIRIYRDAERVTINPHGRDIPLWWVAISSTHSALGEIYKGTHWKGRAGAPGTWAQALRGLDETGQRAFQMRIDGQKNWVVPLLWDVVFPDFNESGDTDEIQMVDRRDRLQTKVEKGQ